MTPIKDLDFDQNSTHCPVQVGPNYLTAYIEGARGSCYVILHPCIDRCNVHDIMYADKWPCITRPSCYHQEFYLCLSNHHLYHGN